MRFCIVSTQKHWGGGEALLHSMARELSAGAHSVSWIVRRDSEVALRLASSGQQVLHQLKRRGSNLRDWLATVRALRSWVPDVVLLNDTHAVPLVGSATWFCRNPRPLRLAYKHTVFPLRSKLKYELLADKLICVSRAARDTLIRGGLAPERSLVVYGGCTPPLVAAQGSQQIRHEFGLPDGHPLIVCVGSLLGCKGHADLIRAMRAVVVDYPNARLVIAGQGDEEQNLKRLIDELGLSQQARLLGFRTDADQLLAAADLVVHPSHAEGLSLVLIQAQMLCKPIVATAVGGTVEVLDAGNAEGCSSWIAEPREPESLATQIRLALAAIQTKDNVLPARLSQTAARTRELFDLATNTRQLAERCAALL